MMATVDLSAVRPGSKVRHPKVRPELAGEVIAVSEEWVWVRWRSANRCAHDVVALADLEVL